MISKNKTSIVFTGDIGFDRYMDRRWEDDNLLSGPILDFFHSADHTVANVEGALIDAVDDGSRGIFFHSMNPAATRVLKLAHADIWSIGNNHTMDAGREGVISTKNIAKEMGCRTVGAGLNEKEASEPVYLEEAGGIGMIRQPQPNLEFSAGTLLTPLQNALQRLNQNADGVLSSPMAAKSLPAFPAPIPVIGTSNSWSWAQT